MLHPLPHAGPAPSLWIGLGLLGVGALALVKGAGLGGGAFGAAAFRAAEPAVAMLSKLAATALWSFGIWSQAAAVLLLVHYLRSAPLPYGLGWRGFTPGLRCCRLPPTMGRPEQRNGTATRGVITGKVDRLGNGR